MLDGKIYIEHLKEIHRKETERFLLIHPKRTWDWCLRRQYKYMLSRQEGEMNEMMISLKELGIEI